MDTETAIKQKLQAIAERLHGVKVGSKRWKELMADLDAILGEDTERDLEVETEWEKSRR